VATVGPANVPTTGLVTMICAVDVLLNFTLP